MLRIPQRSVQRPIMSRFYNDGIYISCSNASFSMTKSTSVQTTLGHCIPCPGAIFSIPEFRNLVLSHRFQKLFRALRPRDCFPRAEAKKRAEDVVFCCRLASAERYVAQEVVEADKGDERDGESRQRD